MNDIQSALGISQLKNLNIFLKKRNQIAKFYHNNLKNLPINFQKIEKDFYSTRAPREWLEILAPLGTDEHKPFLETAPYLIAIFAQVYGVDKNGEKTKNYYVNESVGIATGLLISAIHYSGLASLTHTPSPMRFLNQILERPESERPFLLLVVGYPAADARVPVIRRKSLNEITTYF